MNKSNKRYAISVKCFFSYDFWFKTDFSCLCFNNCHWAFWKNSLFVCRIGSNYNFDRVSLKPKISCCWLVFTLSFFMTQNLKLWISTYGLFKWVIFAVCLLLKIRRLKKLLKLRSYYWQAKPSKWQNWAPRRILISPLRSELASFNPNNIYNSVTNYP